MTLDERLMTVGKKTKMILNEGIIQDKKEKYFNAFNLPNVTLKNNPYSRSIISGALAYHDISINNFSEFLTDMQDGNKKEIFLDHIDRLDVLPDFYVENVIPSMFVSQQDIDKDTWIKNAEIASLVFSRAPHLINDIPEGQINEGDKMKLNSIIPTLQSAVSPEGTVDRKAIEYAFNTLYGLDARKYNEKDFEKIQKNKEKLTNPLFGQFLEIMDNPSQAHLSWYEKDNVKILTWENVLVIPPFVKGYNKLTNRNNISPNKAKFYGKVRAGNESLKQFGKDMPIPLLGGTRGIISIKFPDKNISKAKDLLKGLPEVQRLLLTDKGWDEIIQSPVVREQMWGALAYSGGTFYKEDQPSRTSMAEAAMSIGKGPSQVELAKKKDYKKIVKWRHRPTWIGKIFDQETGPFPMAIWGEREANIVFAFNPVSMAEKKEHPTGQTGWAKKDIAFGWATKNVIDRMEELELLKYKIGGLEPDNIGDAYKYANAIRLKDSLNRGDIVPGYTKESMEEEIKEANLPEAFKDIDWNTTYKGNDPTHPMYPFQVFNGNNIRFEPTAEGGWRPYYIDNDFIEQPIPMWEGGGTAKENYYPDWDNSIENKENIFYAEGMQNERKRVTTAEKAFGDAYDIFNQDNNLTNLNVRMKKIITDLYVFWAKQRDKNKREFFQTTIPGLVKDWANSVGIKHGFDKVYKDIFSKEDWKYFDPNTPEFMNLPDARK